MTIIIGSQISQKKTGVNFNGTS